jgi:uncharacterized protein YbjT (DUF2867 family)
MPPAESLKIAVFGASGMIGRGVLRECLLAGDVAEVVAFGRSPLGEQDPKLRDVVHRDLFDLASLGDQLAGFDAVFYCLGVTSAGMSEADYTRTTHDLTVAIARPFAERSPQATFIFVSGMGADSSETSRTMWARIKGKAENAVLALPFRAVHVFRPGFVQPLHGIRSRTRAYNLMYAVIRPLVPVLRLFMGKHMTTTERIGRAMLHVVRFGDDRKVIDCQQIDALGRLGLAGG